MGFLDNMKQLMEIKQRMEETKKRLDAMEITAENDYVKVTVTGNRKVKNVFVLNTEQPVMLGEKTRDAINEALDKADSIMQSEMLGATRGMMPDMPNLPE